MPYYESVFIARQDISGAQVDSLTESFTNIIQEGGGQVTKKEFWGLRSLAYKIKKNRKGHYVLLNIDGPSDAVLEMERNMRINEDVCASRGTRERGVHHAPQPRQPRSRPWRPARRL
jgi:small subunit ribosomal protein S6